MSDNQQLVVCDGHMQNAPSHISQRLDGRQFVYRVKQNELPMSVVETER